MQLPVEDWEAQRKPCIEPLPDTGVLFACILDAPLAEACVDRGSRAWGVVDDSQMSQMMC